MKPIDTRADHFASGALVGGACAAVALLAAIVVVRFAVDGWAGAVVEGAEAFTSAAPIVILASYGPRLDADEDEEYRARGAATLGAAAVWAAVVAALAWRAWWGL